MTTPSDFQPFWACPPGASIREYVKRRHVSLGSLAASLAMSERDLIKLFDGDLAITPLRAEKIALHLGGNRRFWLVREGLYRQRLRELKAEAKDWLSSLPLRDMEKCSWLQPAKTTEEKLRNALDFFNVASVDEWRDKWLSDRAGLTAYRTSPIFTKHAASAAAWLRQGERAADHLPVASWCQRDFEALLPRLRPLSRVSEPRRFLPQLQRLCASCGVSVVVVRAPQGCPASGATRVVNGRPILQLSFRYHRDDIFWFTFFHEAGHLVLHGDRLFMETTAMALNDHEEREANEFAERVLIPPKWLDALSSLPKNYQSIMRFARQISISPGIVVGQLQYRGIVPPNKFNYLKKTYHWSRDSIL